MQVTVVESLLPHILEVTGLPPDFSLNQVDSTNSPLTIELNNLLVSLRLAGATLKHFHRHVAPSSNNSNNNNNNNTVSSSTTSSNSTQKVNKVWTTLAVFKTNAQAKEAMEKLNPTLQTLKLRPWTVKAQGNSPFTHKSSLHSTFKFTPQNSFFLVVGVAHYSTSTTSGTTFSASTTTTTSSTTSETTTKNETSNQQQDKVVTPPAKQYL
jgi:hypothetical protein